MKKIRLKHNSILCRILDEIMYATQLKGKRVSFIAVHFRTYFEICKEDPAIDKTKKFAGFPVLLDDTVDVYKVYYKEENK